MLAEFLTLDFIDTFPFVEDVLAKDTVEAAYQDCGHAPASLAQLNAKACIFAHFAIMIAHLDQVDSTPLGDPDDYAREAKRLLILDGHEVLNIITIQTLIILVSQGGPMIDISISVNPCWDSCEITDISGR